MYKLVSPLRVKQSKKKDFILNLNVYRNTHYRTLNTVKINYKIDMTGQIAMLPVMDRIKITYVLYPKTRRRTDISNVLSVHDKFFCDALVDLGKLVDDSYIFLPEVNYRFGNIDPDDPRVEIIVESIT